MKKLEKISLLSLKMIESRVVYFLFFILVVVFGFLMVNISLKVTGVVTLFFGFALFVKMSNKTKISISPFINKEVNESELDLIKVAENIGAVCLGLEFISESFIREVRVKILKELYKFKNQEVMREETEEIAEEQAVLA